MKKRERITLVFVFLFFRLKFSHGLQFRFIQYLSFANAKHFNIIFMFKIVFIYLCAWHWFDFDFFFFSFSIAADFCVLEINVPPPARKLLFFYECIEVQLYIISCINVYAINRFQHSFSVNLCTNNSDLLLFLFQNNMFSTQKHNYCLIHKEH